MKQKWWLIAAGALGITLAALLFPKPDTGDTLVGDANNVTPLDFKDDNDGPRVVKPGDRQLRASKRDLRPVNGKLGPNPVAAEMMQRRNTPEAVHAIRLSGPWTVIRRQLMMQGSDEAKEWADGLAQEILDLRALRRDPESQDWDELRQRQEGAIAELKGQPTWLEDEIVAQQITRIEETFASYEQALANGGEVETTTSAVKIPPAPQTPPKE